MKKKVAWNKGLRGLWGANSGSFKIGNKPKHAGVFSTFTNCEFCNKRMNKYKGVPGKMYKVKTCSRECFVRLKSIQFKPIPIEKRPKPRRGNDSNFWIDGRNPENKRLRSSLDYKIWREAVFARDNWICVDCGQHGGDLQADHIKPFSLYPELRFAIDNGRTLCASCHRQTDTFGRRLEYRRVNG